MGTILNGNNIRTDVTETAATSQEVQDSREALSAINDVIGAPIAAAFNDAIGTLLATHPQASVVLALTLGPDSDVATNITAATPAEADYLIDAISEKYEADIEQDNQYLGGYLDILWDENNLTPGHEILIGEHNDYYGMGYFVRDKGLPTGADQTLLSGLRKIRNDFYFDSLHVWFAGGSVRFARQINGKVSTYYEQERRHTV